MTRTLTIGIAAMLAAGISSCASTPEPKLYPNSHLKQVGSRTALQDIAECKQLAWTSGVNEHKDGEVGRKAAGGAAIVFRQGIDGVQWLFFGFTGERVATLAAELPAWRLLLAPALGGLLIGLFVYFFMPDRRPQGVPEVIVR